MLSEDKVLEYLMKQTPVVTWTKPDGGKNHYYCVNFGKVSELLEFSKVKKND